MSFFVSCSKIFWTLCFYIVIFASYLLPLLLIVLFLWFSTLFFLYVCFYFWKSTWLPCCILAICFKFVPLLYRLRLFPQILSLIFLGISPDIIFLFVYNFSFFDLYSVLWFFCFSFMVHPFQNLSAFTIFHFLFVIIM